MVLYLWKPARAGIRKQVAGTHHNQCHDVNEPQLTAGGMEAEKQPPHPTLTGKAGLEMMLQRVAKSMSSLWLRLPYIMRIRRHGIGETTCLR